jgi:hypothetical protein
MGGTKRIMIDQTYPGPEDDRAHFADLRPAFEDPRYVRIGGKPVFFVFRPNRLPDGAEFIDRWQKMATDAGLGGLYTIACGPFLDLGETTRQGFDGLAFIEKPFDYSTPTSRRTAFLSHTNLRRGPFRYTYADTCTSSPPADFACTAIPCVWPNWDDTPRRGRDGVVAVGSSPERFERQVASAVDMARRAPEAEQMILIKSWNEWAEGNYLEPDQEFGLGWLEAVARGLASKGVRPATVPGV